MRFLVITGGMLLTAGTSVPFANAVLGGEPVAVVYQGSITGTVTNSATSTPLAGASVTVAGTQVGAITDLNGRYVLAGVTSGNQKIRAAMTGYTSKDSTVAVAEEKEIVLDFQLDTTVARRALNRRR